MGDNGQGLVLKLAINVSLAVQMLAFSEGLLLAEGSGVERQLARLQQRRADRALGRGDLAALCQVPAHVSEEVPDHA